MSCYIHIFDETQTRIWGLTNTERIQREMERAVLARKTRQNSEAECRSFAFVQHLEEVPADGTVLLLRGDYLYDVRILANLVESTDTALQIAAEGSPVSVAANIPAGSAYSVKNCIQGATELPAGIQVETPESLVPASQIRLKKAHAPFILPITPHNSRELEDHLFRTAYKGVTDLVTKWVWPAPAKAVTRLCVRLGLTPNQITALSWLLAAVTGLLFYNSALGAGLATGWLMTFLDTVDGKLARVTVTSSPLGNYLDHVLDLLHPPFWYLAWGLGLKEFDPALLPADMLLLMVLIFIGYIAGRVAEGAFSQWIGSFGIYTWQRIDSFNRLVTARRNPCLIFLTIGLVVGRPDLALEAVAIWTLLSTLFLLIRLGMGIHARVTQGTLYSWLTELSPADRDRSLAARWFSH